MSESRRDTYKKSFVGTQRARRAEVLERQRQARRDLTEHARALASAKTQNEDEMLLETQMSSNSLQDTSSESDQSHNHLRKRRKKYFNQLMTPEWMLEVPEELNGKGSMTGEGWYVVPRPEGKRCLVISANGHTIARLQSGNTFKRFASVLPAGSRRRGNNAGGDNFSILDCIFQDDCFYVLDIMCWKGYLLYNCTAEFRFYWIRSKLGELDGLDTKTDFNPYRFLPIPYFEADASGIESAYQTEFGYIKDGILFYMKLGQYEMSSASPLMLLWKDESCSRYFVYSDKPTAVLELVEKKNLERDVLVLQTLDGVKLSMPFQNIDAETGDLLRFSFSSATITTEGHAELADLEFQKKCSAQRGVADCWSKILFQYQAHANDASRVTFTAISEAT